MTLTHYPEVTQGSDKWLWLRCGVLTASNIKDIMTPTLKPASNDKERQHLYELAAQRITGYVEPHFISDDMLRGVEDEIDARALYSQKIAPVTECGFITNDKWGVKIGYSPDGLVGKSGAIECKSRRQKYHVQTVCDNQVPAEFVLQIQTGLLVAELDWIDFVSYCAGLPMFVIRVCPDSLTQSAIVEAARAFELRLRDRIERFHHVIKTEGGLPTVRKERNQGEMV